MAQKKARIFEITQLIKVDKLKSGSKKLGSYVKHVAGKGPSQTYIPSVARLYSKEAYLIKDDVSDGSKSFKGHDMLAPFTAGWQTTEANPLVIDKSEACSCSF
ncbi:unnamed protein product [Linum tenue]|uniref:Uncharacterized protein n=1 Tax=Linum tenue TaxID=586396 RepID=A0AAV0GNF4_9ROSI|nr:unnamed protein product [Linum tenue]